MSPADFGRALRALGIRESDRMELRAAPASGVTFGMLRDGAWKHVDLGDQVNTDRAFYRIGKLASESGLVATAHWDDRYPVCAISFTKGESE